MPFKSKAQQRYMFSQHPKIAKEFAEHTNFKKLPEKVESAKKTPRVTTMRKFLG